MEANSLTVFSSHRINLIRKGIDELAKENVKKGIYFLSKSCFTKFHYDENQRFNSEVFTFDQIASDVTTEIDNSDPLLSFITQELSGVSIESDFVDVVKEEDNVERFFKRCSELPKEWNIVQLNRLDVAYNGFQTVEEICTNEAPILFSIFRHSLSDAISSEPLVIKKDSCDVRAKKLFHSSYQLYLNQFKNYNDIDQKVLSANLAELTENLKKWLGPWIVLFTGKVKGKDGEKFESEIYVKVNEVSKKIDLNERQRILLSLVARRCDLLGSDSIQQAAEQIAEKKDQFAEIVKFLSKLRSTLVFESMSYYPCLIVLDQYLDYFPWEMVVPKQEMARFNSMSMLFDLYGAHKENIKDGYLRINTSNVVSLMNPDKDAKLNEMTKRMADYYETTHPNWKCIKEETPTNEKMIEILETSDVFVYSGHGSSLQLLLPSDIKKIRSKSVLFLFGCDSVAMTIENGNVEPYASHLTLFKTKCPAIIGAITIIIDNWADIVTILLLNQCFPANEKWKPKYFSPHYVEISQQLFKRFRQIEPNILAAISNIRCSEKISLRMRSVLVYRGLPAHSNSN